MSELMSLTVHVPYTQNVNTVEKEKCSVNQLVHLNDLLAAIAIYAK